MDAFFQNMGANWNQVKVLVSLYVRLDLRAHRRQSQSRKLSPVVRSLIFYSIMGIMLSTNLVARAESFMYTFLIMAYSMVMMAFSVVLEFGYSFLHTEDADILIHRPISSSTLLFAKVFHLLFFVFTMGSAIVLVPSLVGVGVRGVSWTYPVVFFIFATLGNLAAASFILLIYTWLLGRLDQERFKDILAYLHMGVAFLLFFGYNLIPRIGAFTGGEFSPSGWMYAAPPAWFAGAVQAVQGNSSPMFLRLGAMGCGATVLLFILLFRRILSHDFLFQESRDRVKTPKPQVKPQRQRREAGFVERLLSHNLEMQTGYRIAVTMFRRDRYVKTSIYPLLGLPLAVFVLAVIQKEVTDPFLAGLAGAGSFSNMVIFFLFFVMLFSLRGMTYSRDWEAAWIYHAAPLSSPGRFYQGVKLAIFLRVVLPLFVLLAFFYCSQIYWIHGIQHTLTLFLISMLSFAMASFTIRDYPFSRPRVRGEQTQRFMSLLIIMPFFIAALLVQAFAYQNRFYWWILQVLLCILILTLEKLSKKQVDRRFIQMEFTSYG